MSAKKTLEPSKLTKLRQYRLHFNSFEDGNDDAKVSYKPLDDDAAIETAARQFLVPFLRQHEGLADVVPDLELKEIRRDILGDDARIVEFIQTASGVPICNTRITVEINDDGRLAGFNAFIYPPPNPQMVSPERILERTQALKKIGDFCGIANPMAFFKNVDEPAVQYLLCERDGEAKWHLVYHFTDVPVVPPNPDKKVSKKRSFGYDSPRKVFPMYDYFVDAHDGEILLFFSSVP